jgi:hypothetical protein
MEFYKTNNNLNKDSKKIQQNQNQFDGNIYGYGIFTDNNNNTNIYDTNVTPKRNPNSQNLMQINESNKHEEEDDKFYKGRRSSFMKSFNNNNFSTKRFSIINTNITEKEKRTILEHYRNMYSIKKPSNNKQNEINENKFPYFPVISGQGNNLGQYSGGILGSGNNSLRTTINFPNNNNNDNLKTQSNFTDKNSLIEKENYTITQKNSMFRSSIYTSLMSNKTNTNFKNTNTIINNNNNNNMNMEYEIMDNYNNNTFGKTKGKINKNKSKSVSVYGPFLNINNEYDQEIEIKNPEIKKSLEDINYYGPYFSHCPICRHKNLDFYQTLEPHQCMKLLNYLKIKRSKIQVK